MYFVIQVGNLEAHVSMEKTDYSDYYKQPIVFSGVKKQFCWLCSKYCGPFN